jgi:beta-mannosidase
VNDCLSLPLRQGSGGIRPLGSWEALWMPLGEGEGQGLPTGNGAGWEPIAVPAQHWGREGRSAVWYRTRFPRPDHDGRILLRIGGAFLASNVWLNGRFLGSHYGYFAPFGFDATPFLREENLLVICCEAPIETDLQRKRHLMGIFNDGDSRPYPSSAWFSLPPTYRWEVPVGLWRAVELEYTGPVVLDRVRLRPRIEAGDVGRVEVEARLRNLDGREMQGEVAVELEGPELATPLRLRRAFTLAGVSERTVEMTMTVPRVMRWWPWRTGEQHLYRAVTTVITRGRDSVRAEDAFGFRDVVVNASQEGWTVLVNGQPMFLRGADYMPGLQLDHLGQDVFAQDLRLAREANLDVLRVHGHVLPEAFYRLADAAGMLVIADFALTLSYAYHATAEETRFFETAVRTQVPEMLELLRNRPSVMLWVGHDDPPWIPANAAMGDVHAVRQNYTIDQEIKTVMEELDPSRTALAASGELDQHLWLGWREGGWQDFADVLPGFVSEFGAQALPDLDSPAWETLGRRWPVSEDDPRWLHAGFQPPAWAERGAGLPGDYGSLEQFIEASQDYQAWLCGYAIDQLRKRKFEPCWGAVVYALTDSFSGVGFGLMDSVRRPKLALDVVREAFAPLRVIIDPVGFHPLVPFGVGWRPGEDVVIRLVVVNDDPDVGGAAELRWGVGRERALERSGMGRVLDAVRRKSWAGGMTVTLPTAAEPALQVAALTFPMVAEGDYRFEVELRVGGQDPLRTALAFRVAEELPTDRRRPPLPAYLAERIVVVNSLEQLEDGLRFTLRNRTRPAVLTGLGDFRVDGRRLDAPRVLVETEAGRVPFLRRVELPMERDVVLLVELDGPLEPGPHQLEMDLTVPGVASGRVGITGSVTEGRMV